MQMGLWQETENRIQEQQEVEEEQLDKTDGKDGEGEKKEWENVTMTRRRSLKVTPNLDIAKKRQLREKLKEKGTHRKECNENSFEVLMDLEENNE